MTTHPSPVTEVSRSLRMLGRATETTVTSSSTMKKAMPVTARVAAWVRFSVMSTS
ncbi:hypothetical protein [Nocardioides rubriscoriae]|uniref:hypothetical protein n=1 Tax=Nocardioides rubriscoriae TaxID=642762 RepID=UPI001FE3949B|nr:hypothetical protein [Nocardioides rubriscoriae]